MEIPSVGGLVRAWLCVATLTFTVAAAQPEAAQPELEQPPADLPPPLSVTMDTRFQPSAKQLAWFHEQLTKEPHIAGTPGDARTIETLERLMREMELQVEPHVFYPYLPRHIESVVELISDSGEAQRFSLREPVLAEDPDTAHPELQPPWNAYSGSGDVTSTVVYANYGTRADFDKLRELGVDLKGKIVIARYGQNFRGYKAKFAEQAGAAAVLLYNDPADSGFTKGLPYPKGGYLSDACAERGSLLTLPYPGDPLTPGVEATDDPNRLNPMRVAFPKIPVQPIPWSAAREILTRMEGPDVPEGWQGGIPTPYKIGGGGARVRVMVKQEREITPTKNVIGILPGSNQPEQVIYIGCHHDAWGFGASDATSGMIALLETARVMSELARAGQRPERTVVFCAWGAEEMGIIGSTEWIESRGIEFEAGAAAYFNLDMASMGPEFNSSAGPTLRTVIIDAARKVPQPRDGSGRTVFDAWLAKGEDELFPGLPKFGELGGGSDHVGFWCHAGVASAQLGGGGSLGTAYHTAYDTLRWYRKVVGEDYAPALMVTRMTLGSAGALAEGQILPLDVTRVWPEVRRQLEAVTKVGREAGVMAAGEAKVDPEFASFASRLERFHERASAWKRQMASKTFPLEVARDINLRLILVDRAWLELAGVPGGAAGNPDRPWFRSLLAATDEDSGYGSWTLPAIRAAIARRDPAMLRAQMKRYEQVVDRLDNVMAELEFLSKQ
jgi:N-acetylated-alpha-linked acidic dipeptidase